MIALRNSNPYIFLFLFSNTYGFFQISFLLLRPNLPINPVQGVILFFF